MENIVEKQCLLPVLAQMPGDYMTCTAMCGSGVRTGVGPIPPAQLLILQVQVYLAAYLAARTGWNVAAAGATASGFVGPRIVTASPQATGTTTLAFASPWPREIILNFGVPCTILTYC